MNNKENKHALLVGIDYCGDEYELNGCCTDVRNVNELIKNFGIEDITILNDRSEAGDKIEGNEMNPTRNKIIDNLKKLIEGKKDSYLFFQYSGHGSYVTDYNGDEEDGYDECLIPVDYNNGVITDDLLYSILGGLDKSCRLDAAFDCCHSGTILDLPYSWKYEDGDLVRKENKTGNDKRKSLNGEIIMLSGCLDSQTSKEIYFGNKAEGAFTGIVRRILDEKPDMNLYDMVIEINKQLEQKVQDQSVQISTNMDLTIEDLKKRKFYNETNFTKEEQVIKQDIIENIIEEDDKSMDVNNEVRTSCCENIMKYLGLK